LIDINLLQNNLNELKRLNKEIPEILQLVPQKKTLFNIFSNKKKQNKIILLYEQWTAIARIDYPMVMNSKEYPTSLTNYSKEVQALVKSAIRAERMKVVEPVYISPSLDKMISRNEDNIKLINKVLYSHDTITDQPDSMRKRRKIIN